MPNTLTERAMIRTDQELVSLCNELRTAGRFSGWTRSFWGNGPMCRNFVWCKSPLRSSSRWSILVAIRDLAPLWALIVDPTIAKVLHAAREDLRLAYYGGGRGIPRNIFDTQVAAGFVGLPMYPLSYARLTEALVSVKLGKGETRSEWDRRPLTPEQIAYARDDVRYFAGLSPTV